MKGIFDIIHMLFEKSPEMAFFLSLGLGYLVGKISFGKFQMGGVAGSLLMAVLVSQLGVPKIDDALKNVLFALFIFAVGYTSGPMFFKSLGRKTLKEIAMVVSLAASALVTVIVVAKLFHLDKGLAAGIAAGGLTQSAIIGTASSSIKALGLDTNAANQLIANVSVGYGVTYIFGSFGTIIVCTVVLQKFMGRSIRDDAVKAEASMITTFSLKDGEVAAVPTLVGRIFNPGKSAGQTVLQLENLIKGDPITVERIKRNGKIFNFLPTTVLEENDQVLVIGKRDALIQAEKELGAELALDSDMNLAIKVSELIVDNKNLVGKSIKELYSDPSEVKHGVYIVDVTRGGSKLKIDASTVFEHGDVVTLYGAESDIRKMTKSIGYELVHTIKTDLVYMSLGILLGLLVGLIVVKVKSIPITLGSGGGSLLSGLFFGWYRTKHLRMGQISDSTAQFMKDIGLAGFVAIVGLNYGLDAMKTIKADGISIFIAGLIITTVPLLITMFIGKYIIKYDNVAIFAGSLSGSRSANPAFGEVLNKAGNSIPTVPFAITYALANVFLTLLGPLVIAFA